MNLGRFKTGRNRNRSGPVRPVTAVTGPVPAGLVNPGRARGRNRQPPPSAAASASSCHHKLATGGMAETAKGTAGRRTRWVAAGRRGGSRVRPSERVGAGGLYLFRFERCPGVLTPRAGTSEQPSTTHGPCVRCSWLGGRRT